MSYYQDVIRKIDPTINAAGVEGMMRTVYGTLDHLSRADIVQEIKIARYCEEEKPGFLKSVANTQGYSEDYEAEEKRLGRAA